jgi:hypothetical protein
VKQLYLSSLDLISRYSSENCFAYTTTMTTLTFHELAQQNPKTSYLHINPRIRRTGVARGLPWWQKGIGNAGFALLSPWSLEVEEVGERMLEMAFVKSTSSVEVYERLGDGEKGESINGQVGTHSLWKTGEVTSGKEALEKMFADGSSKKVWGHTFEIFDAARKRNDV